MIHLITVGGKSARGFFLEQQHLSNFKSLMRTITSGRVLIISSIIQSDIFYTAEKSNTDSILKLWAFYANTTLSSLDRKDLITSIGDDKSLNRYFQAINRISTNWYHYSLYKKAFQYSFSNDRQNPVAKTIVECDQYLVEHPSITRTPLIYIEGKIDANLIKDTFSLAMRIINNELSN